MPEGLKYVPGFLDEARQQELQARLEAIPEEAWGRVRFRGVVARRRKISYGVDYQPEKRAYTPAEPMPDFVADLRDRAASALGLEAARFVQSSLQWYPPGAGIGPHRDAPMFGPEVFGLSLGSPGRLILRRGDDRHELLLEPGSLVLLSGPARAAWTHEMPPVKAPRWSVYFRTLRKGQAGVA